MEEQKERMSPATQAILLFAGFFVVGFIIVGGSKETPEEKMARSFMQASNMLDYSAREKCAAAVYEKTGERVYAPSESGSDRQNWVELTWRGNGKIKEAFCRYESANGITLFKINGETVSQYSTTANSAGTGASADAAKKTGSSGVHH